MSGYKRVNFYELCRLCATNQQKEKTHIFQEEGRKIQLQNKIQSCLSLKVCENDFLPKVVCAQCLRTLEECCLFRQECYTSEMMLSSYFNNFRYTDDFKKSGKVYIKDTSVPVATATVSLPPPPPPPPPEPYYAVQLPVIEPKPVVSKPEIIAIIDSLVPVVPAKHKPPKQRQVAPKPDEKRHGCDVCNKTFKRREHLYQHVKLHTGFRPFTCEHCNKSFLRKEHLLRHMVAHSGQKNYTCTICNKSFSRNDNLLKHRKIHSKRNSFTCEICQKQFVMEHYYYAHKRTHDTGQTWGLLKAI